MAGQKLPLRQNTERRVRGRGTSSERGPYEKVRVRLVREPVFGSAKIQRALERLDLREVGQEREIIGPGNRCLRSLRHAHGFVVWSWYIDGRERRDLVIETYSAGGGRGREIDVPGSGSILYEIYDSYVTLTWPTTYKPFKLLGTLKPIFELNTEDITLYLDHGEDESEKPAGFQDLRRADVKEHLEVARLADADRGIELIWQRSLDEDSRFYEGGVIAPDLTPEEVRAVLSAAGTGAVRAHVEELLHAIFSQAA
jgi:hypothetical protein